MAKKKPEKRVKGIPLRVIDVHSILRKYYQEDTKAYKILVAHSELVAKKAPRDSKS